MLALRTFNGQVLELSPNATISIELNNALLADADNNGSYALPFTLPRTARNQVGLGFPELLDNAAGQARSYEGTDIFDEDGRHLLTGTLQLLRITASTYELTLLFGASAVMAKLKAAKLRNLVLGGPRLMESLANAKPILYHMNDTAANPGAYDYVFAPASNNDAFEDYDDDTLLRYPNLNCWRPAGGLTPWAVEGFSVTSGNFSGGIGTYAGQLGFPGFYPRFATPPVPFVRLGYLVRTMLRELSVPFEEDVFDAEMEQLVVVGNNIGPGMALLDPYDPYSQVPPPDRFIRLADLLPDLTCAELLRELADTFYLDLSVSPTGLLRIRRTSTQLALPPAVQLTRYAQPGYDVDLGESQALEMTYLVGDDKIASENYQVPDPEQLGANVANFAALPQPSVTHEVRLVLDEDAYYQHDGTAWVFFSQHILTVTVGGPSDNVTQVAQGIDLLLDMELPPAVLLPIPGITNDVPHELHTEIMRVPMFGVRSYAPQYNLYDRSKALRLAFYRGKQPYKDATQPGGYPMLSAASTNQQGVKVGNYSLRLAGDDGTVARWGQAVLELRANPQTVTWPVWLDAEQFN
ncbi:MAG: hypothetical protein EOO59_04060, partial [Hymenobacter sp.]